MELNDFLKLQIYEAYTESTITDDEKEYLFTVTENVFGDMLRKRDFKKTFQYNRKEKTITVDGEKYKVDLSTWNPIVKIKDMQGNTVTTLRQTAASLTGKDEDDGIIMFDGSFFKIKGHKSREAILQHEIGHLKMHSLNTRSKNLDKRFIHEDQYNQITKGAKQFLPDKVVDDIFRKDEYLSSKTGTEKEKAMRDKIRETALKYEVLTNDHLKPAEFEADRYAANRTSERDFMRGLKQIYEVRGKTKEDRIKYFLLTYGRYPDQEEQNMIDIQMKMEKEDYDQRKKALRDKVLKDAKLLKKSIDEDYKDFKKAVKKEQKEEKKMEKKEEKKSA